MLLIILEHSALADGQLDWHAIHLAIHWQTIYIIMLVITLQRWKSMLLLLLLLLSPPNDTFYVTRECALCIYVLCAKWMQKARYLSIGFNSFCFEETNNGIKSPLKSVQQRRRAILHVWPATQQRNESKSRS